MQIEERDGPVAAQDVGDQELLLVHAHLDAHGHHISPPATAGSGCSASSSRARTETSGNVVPTINTRIATTLTMTATPPSVTTQRATLSRRFTRRSAALLSVKASLDVTYSTN